MKQLTLFILLMITGSTLLFAQSYSGGSGSEGDPCQIATKAEIKYLSENSGEWSKHFIQTASITFVDIDFQSGGGFYNNGDGFIPIGNGTTKFTGSYDGDGFTIDDCFVSGSVTGEENSGGLVGDLRYRAVIHNCGADVTVIGEYNVGGFAARNFSIDYRLIKN